jgi:phospholipid/cholesterol/gamma-HCH transport system ATP-binding protein
MAQNGTAIRFSEVHKQFEENRVLRGVDLTIDWGEVTTILGPSGCGKSVTLKHIIGILRPDSGRVTVDGHDMAHIETKELLQLRKRAGVLFQSSALFDSMSVKENVAFGLRMHTRMTEAEVSSRVAECLEEVNLPGSEEVMPMDLSGGMRKRAALARAIALSPDFVLYDEPTTGLDPRTANTVGELILKLQEDLRITSVVVTHDLALARRISDSVALLYKGITEVQGSFDSIEASGNEIFEQFVSGQL